MLILRCRGANRAGHQCGREAILGRTATIDQLPGEEVRRLVAIVEGLIARRGPRGPIAFVPGTDADYGVGRMIAAYARLSGYSDPDVIRRRRPRRHPSLRRSGRRSSLDARPARDRSASFVRQAHRASLSRGTRGCRQITRARTASSCPTSGSTTARSRTLRSPSSLCCRVSRSIGSRTQPASQTRRGFQPHTASPHGPEERPLCRIRLAGISDGPDLELRQVSALRQGNHDRIGRALGREVQVEPCPQPRGLDSRDWIRPRVELLARAEHLGAERVVLQPGGAPLKRLFHDELE